MARFKVFWNFKQTKNAAYLISGYEIYTISNLHFRYVSVFFQIFLTRNNSLNHCEEMSRLLKSSQRKWNLYLEQGSISLLGLVLDIMKKWLTCGRSTRSVLSNFFYILHLLFHSTADRIITMQVIHVAKSDSRLANNDLPIDVQRLRCRVLYRGLCFSPAIESLGQVGTLFLSCTQHR